MWRQMLERNRNEINGTGSRIISSTDETPQSLMRHRLSDGLWDTTDAILSNGKVCTLHLLMKQALVSSDLGYRLILGSAGVAARSDAL